MKRYSVVQRHKSRGNKTWYGRIHDMDTGTVTYMSLSVDRKKDAIAWRDNMIASQLTGERRNDSCESIDSCVESWMSSLDCNELTRKNYWSAITRMLQWMNENGIRRIGDITPLEVSKFVSSIDDWKASTKRKRVVIYRTWAKWVMEMYETGWNRNPFLMVKVSGEKSRPREFWTIDQVEKIIEAQTDPLVSLMYAFMAFAGLRFSEFNSLKVSDIFEDDGEVKKNLRVDGKGGKVAFVPICTRLREQIISTYQKTFPTLNKEQFLEFLRAAKLKSIHILYTNNLKQNMLLKRLFSQNSILASFGGVVHLHRFRHSFISNLIRSGCNIRCVAELARHENVMITLNTYSHLLPSDKEGALEIFNVRKR